MPRGGWQDSNKYERVELNPEISDDIPIPEKIKIVGGFPFSSLQVGQSFGVDVKYKDKLQRATSVYSRQHNVILITKVMINPKTGVKEARCFRVK